MQVGTCPNMLEYMRLPDSTPQRHAATIPGIKLSHLIYVAHFLTLIKCGIILHLQSIRFSWFRKGY